MAARAGGPWQGRLRGRDGQISFNDRKLLNAMKRAGLVTKGAYSGEWIVERRWNAIGQEAGLAIAMCDAACAVLDAAFGDRATAWVHHWWS